MTDRPHSSLPSALKDLLRPFYRRHKGIIYKMSLPYYRFLDRFRLNDLDAIYDKEYFLKRTSHPWSTTTKVVVAELVERYDPDDIVDIGCAIGVYLQEFKKHGVETIGIEGAEKAVKNAVVDDVFHADLRNPVSVSRSADLVLCIEVAEHLHPKYADCLVKNISECVDSGGVAVVSAAPPGQFGTHHINLQPKRYWINKFESEGLSFDADETESLQSTIQTHLSERELDWDGTRNLMVYRK